MKTITAYCLVIPVLLFTFHFSLTGQEGNHNLNFGKIPQEDLDMKVYPQDTSAEAVVLDEVGEMYFYAKGDIMAYQLSKHVRIKILSEAGFNQAEQKIDYYDYKNT